MDGWDGRMNWRVDDMSGFPSGEVTDGCMGCLLRFEKCFGVRGHTATVVQTWVGDGSRG